MMLLKTICLPKNPSIVLLFSFLLLASCGGDSSDDLVEKTEDPTENPNETAAYTYTSHVKSIMTNNCVSCHSSTPINGASSSLVTYEDVKNYGTSIINRITRNEGEAGFMPKGGTKLPQNLIDQIIQWKEDEYPQ
ncbi:MAG: hypothetical protein P8L72_05700 [Flavobacteriaceae bacterium]|jgi:mono/diheme cytochrome c family protein|nr:hypothetical protein [Flavobacteriaceae bacterium]MDG2314855.1 hypothetical protein [Flavobacteriaceae bacterium]